MAKSAPSRPPGELGKRGHVAAAHEGMADGDLGAHHVEQIIQVGAMVHVGQQLAVHLLHLGPIGAVHVGHVEVIALVAPAFVEDLLELFLGLQIHAQVRRSAGPLRLAEPARSASTRNSDGPAGRAAPPRAASAAPPPPPRRAIHQLVAIGADIVGRNAGDERRGSAIAQTIALQRAAAACAAAAAAAARRRLQIVDRSRHARREVR